MTRSKRQAQSHRLPQGGRIDRDRPLSFEFNGRSLEGFAGDTLASALLANGARIVGRSFKYHRPRGIVASGAEEPNAIIQLGTGALALPARRATRVALKDGMTARSVRGWPGPEFDLLGILDGFSSMLGAGFYYKTLIDRRLWHWAEPLVRRASGMGEASAQADPEHYAHHNVHCDVLVVGAGPAGLAAAAAAARCGARVIIADDQIEPGGQLLGCREEIDGEPALQWVGRQVVLLTEAENATLLTRTTVVGYHDHNFLTAVQRVADASIDGDGISQRQWRIRARQVVLAQGAFERPLVFCNNDRPGVMLASAVCEYVNRYAVLPGRRAVVFTNNDSAYQCALDLLHAGGEVAAVIDSRANPDGDLPERVREAGIEVRTGQVVSRVRGRTVKAVELARLKPGGGALDAQTGVLRCDLLAVSGGWNPAVHLHSQSGGKNQWDEDRHCFVPAGGRQSNRSAGSGNGCETTAQCLQEGLACGFEAAVECGFDPVDVAGPAVAEPRSAPLMPLWRVPTRHAPERHPKQFVDFQNDTSVADIRLALREGYESIEHVKRYTALGFGTDQGKLGNINGMAIVAQTLGKSIPEVGTTTFRPMYTPVRFGAVAGQDVGPMFDPVRKTALHDWHEEAGARFEVVGQWLRPWYFPRDGEDLHQTVARECLAARQSVAIMDASTLGKIEVRGPDALTFLERVYTHRVSKLKAGRCAYGILLGEDGMVMDDGVMARLGDDHYYLTTTTGGAAAVFSWLERWLQTEWPDLKVYLTSVTDHWSAIAVAGPDSRRVLQALDGDMDLDAESMPFMSFRSGTLSGIPARVFRISFSGELAFEINVHSDDARAMWEALMSAGREFDITPYGTETMHVLRAEKGFVIVGQDTDGSVTPVDLGMNWLLARDKDYLGRRSLQRSDCTRKDRKQLVGLVSVDGVTVLPEGAQLVAAPDLQPPVPLLGHVTSSYHSACLGHPIALCLLERGRKRKGERLYAATRTGEAIPVEVVSPVFYDPKGARQNV